MKNTIGQIKNQMSRAAVWLRSLAKQIEFRFICRMLKNDEREDLLRVMRPMQYRRRLTSAWPRLNEAQRKSIYEKASKYFDNSGEAKR